MVFTLVGCWFFDFNVLEYGRKLSSDFLATTVVMTVVPSGHRRAGTFPSLTVCVFQAKSV